MSEARSLSPYEIGNAMAGGILFFMDKFIQSHKENLYDIAKECEITITRLKKEIWYMLSFDVFFFTKLAETESRIINEKMREEILAEFVNTVMQFSKTQRIGFTKTELLSRVEKYNKDTTYENRLYTFCEFCSNKHISEKGLLSIAILIYTISDIVPTLLKGLLCGVITEDPNNIRCREVNRFAKPLVIQKSHRGNRNNQNNQTYMQQTYRREKITFGNIISTILFVLFIGMLALHYLDLLLHNLGIHWLR